MRESHLCQGLLGDGALSPCPHLSSHEGAKSFFVESCLKPQGRWVLPCLSPLIWLAHSPPWLVTGCFSLTSSTLESRMGKDSLGSLPSAAAVKGSGVRPGLNFLPALLHFRQAVRVSGKYLHQSHLTDSKISLPKIF